MRRISAITPTTPDGGRNTIDMTVVDAQMTALKRPYRKTKCCCSLATTDGEEFDFFPMSFLFYILCMIILCIFIITIEIINYNYSYNNENIIDLLFGFTIKSYHNNSFFKLHDINNTLNHNRHTIHTIEYILIYGILILSVWEMLFAFYRYYTTFIATQQFKVASTKKVIQKFPFYALIFIILFIIEIHLWYFIFPLTILYYCIFNCYCTYKFAMMLIERYKMFIDMDDNIGYETGVNQDILNSVIFMKNTSLLSCGLQSIYLSLFLFLYNVTIIYYLPILWSISSFITTINFVRNRRYLQHQILRLKQYFKCYKKVKANLNEKIKTVRRLSLKPLSSLKTRKSLKSHREKTEKIISKNDNNEMQLNLPKTNTKINISKSDGQIQLNLPKPTLSLEAHSDNIEMRKMQNKHSKMTSNTAPLTKHELKQNYNESETIDTPFKINLNQVRSNPVVIAKDKRSDEKKRSRSNASNVDSKNVSFALPDIIKQHSGNESGYRDNKSSNTSSKRVSFALQNMDENLELDASLMIGGDFLLDIDDELRINGSRRSTMRPNKALELLGIKGSSRDSPFITPKSRSRKDGTGTRSPTVTFVHKLSNKLSKSKSLPKTWFVNVISNEVDNDDELDSKDDINTPLPDDTDMKNMVSFESIPPVGNKTDNEDDDDGFEFVFGNDYMQDDIKNDEIVQDPMPIFKTGSMTHKQSISAPANIEEMVESLNILAKYGFCSRKSINSIKQLTKYQKKLNENNSSMNNIFSGIDEDNEVDEVVDTTAKFSKFHSS